MSNGWPRCPSCGHSFQVQIGYVCVKCGTHFDTLYRREHRDPEWARTMTSAGIAAEYRAAGQIPVAGLYRERSKR